MLAITPYTCHQHRGSDLGFEVHLNIRMLSRTEFKGGYTELQADNFILELFFWEIDGVIRTAHGSHFLVELPQGLVKMTQILLR